MINLTSIAVSPWLGLVGFLIFLKQIKDNTSIKLDKNTCKVLWGICQIELGENYNDHTLNVEDILKVTNQELKIKATTPLTKQSVVEEINELEKLDIVLRINDNLFEVNTRVKVYKTMPNNI